MFPSAEFEKAQQVCPTYTWQRSFICMLLTRHHKSQPSSCFTRQHRNRVASSLTPLSPPHINLSMCTLGHPLTIPVSVSPICWKNQLAGISDCQYQEHKHVVQGFTSCGPETDVSAGCIIEEGNEPLGD